jgi:glycerol kinase
VDSWLIFKLTGEHATDATNASRTMLYDIGAGRWDPELLDLFGVPERALPRVLPSAGAYGVTRPDALHGHAIALSGVAGDQQAALFGHACVEPATGKNTYGTGSFVLVNAGFVAPRPPPGLLVTAASTVGQERAYALEASIFITGAAVQWLRDGLRIIERAEETEQLARTLDDNGGVYFVPALTGLGSPHWDPHARGTIVGLTRGSGRAHIARAALEAIAYQTVDAVRAIERATGEPLRELRADGGASTNSWLMQFQADVLGIPVVLGRLPQTTALGAAYLAGIGAGQWTLADLREADARLAAQQLRRFEPQIDEAQRAALLAGWGDALARARSGHA